MRKCIVTVGIPKNKNTSRMYEISGRSIAQYAKKIGVPYFPISERKYSLKRPEVPHLEKLWVGDFLKDYDQVLFLDLDILIMPTARNIFDLYPENKIFGYDEGALAWVQDDVKFFEKKYNLKFPLSPSGRPFLLNGGVMLWSKNALPLFENFDLKNFTRSFGDTAGEQTYFNYLIHKLDLPFGTLDEGFNWCIYADEKKYFTRFNADFVHYASDGHWINKKSKYEQIEEDFFLGPPRAKDLP